MPVQFESGKISGSRSYSNWSSAGSEQNSCYTKNLKKPDNKKAVQRLLGSVNYLRKFIPNLSELTSPLRQLLQNKTVFKWEVEHSLAFEQIKNVLSELPNLKYYDINKNNVISVDSSSHSMGAVLFQDGYPIAYASKALTNCQMHYPQIEKEALAIRFGCTQFHSYIYGKPLEIETDHKPLETILKSPPTVHHQG